VADLADRLAPIFGLSVPDYLSELLRPLLQEELPKAADELMKLRAGKAKGKTTTE
jgi:hypothetical protein